MRNVQVNMQFNADTSAAQSQIQQLQNTLHSIANTKVTVQGGSIDQAVQSAKMLNQHLVAATNVNTGKLDFTALQTSLKAANTDLTTLTNNLLAMGPKGQQAFSQAANAVAHAELSVKKTNTALANFGVTLMNTIKWQAASTMIHGVMGAFSAAVGHIEKLDKALNNIQIVTGKTSAEMASFAKRAQELSKALSSTTEEYAKASLIYFQQGLGEKAVLDRTEATLKMAKVTGDSVEDVSNQLTAIWNNFDNGTKSLEYYVDVITALGAATASSTSEISDGLQKFAAIAETVGLSYEYAATALATITAETRQSADVVGTALKTLFARMEGLKLGETLEDGTTLNQYSQAMAKAGINIKDANGNLKEMDTILNEMGAKWQTLNKDQQVALAQQVGGIRQYNQLIALMDNWDTFKINLEIAENSKGELEKQFSIYQNSIEASEKALQNAKEALYENLFNPKMIKDFNYGLAEALNIINRIVDAAGGLQGLLKFGGLILLKTLLPHLQGFILKISASISNVIGLTQKQKINTVDKTAKTERKISGQEQTRSWGGKGERAGKAFTKAAAANEQGDFDKRDRFAAKGKKISQKINKKEQAIMDHQSKADEAKEIREAKNSERIKAGKRPKGEGFKEHWHNTRAQQLEERATTGKAPSATTLGVKTSNLPSTDAVDSSASAGTMSTQISKEQAGYTAAILESKKEYLMIENQLTDTQKAQYKNYEDQINAENDLLKLARERQMVSKEKADEVSKSAASAVEMSEDGGKRIEAAAREQATKDIDESDIGQRKARADQRYKAKMADIENQEKQLGEEREDEDQDTKTKRAQLKQRKKDVEASHSAVTKEYDSAVQERANSLMTSDDFSKKVDFGGEKTAAASKRVAQMTAPDNQAPATAEQAAMSEVAAAAGMENGGTAVASVENLEKLGTLQGQYNADAQVAVDLQGELGTAIGIAGDKAQKGTKAYDAGNKSLKQAGTFAQKYAKQINAAADEMQASGNYTKDQVDAVRKLAKEGATVDLENMQPDDLKAIEVALGKVEGGLKKAGAAAGTMADGMASDMANATGATKDTFTAVSAGAQQLAADTTDANQQAMNLQTTMQKPVPVQPDPYGGLVMGAQGALQAVTGLAMGASMLQMGLQTAFDPEATGIEQLTGLMMMMQGVQSLLTVGQALHNVAVGAGNVIMGVATAIREKGMLGMLKEIGLKALDTAATIVNAVAKVFNAEASRGLAGVIMGVLAAALIIGTVAMVANTVATEADTDAAQDSAKAKEAQAEGAREAAQAAREELDAVLELTQGYMDALKVFKETGEGKEDLTKAAFEAIDAMNLEGHELEVLSGNYENLTKQIQKYNAVKAQGAVDTSQTAQSASGAAFIAKENVKGTGGLYAKEQDGYSWLLMDVGDNKNALERWINANEDTPWEVNGTTIRAKYASTQDIPYLMKEFYRLYDGVAAIASNSEMESMQFFAEAQSMRDSGSWDMGKELADAYDTHIETSITAGKATHLTGVTNQDEYVVAFEKLVDYTLKQRNITDRNSEEAKKIIDELKTNLSKDENYADFELRRRGIETIKTQYGNRAAAKFIDTNEGESALSKWAKENGYNPDEAYDLFFKINPQYYNSSDELQAALDNMQNYLDAQRLVVKYDFITNAKAALKETMTSEDWTKFYQDNMDLFNEKSDKYIGKTFEEFTNMSHTDRVALLGSQTGNLAANYDQLIAAAETEKEQFGQQRDQFIADKQQEYSDEYVKEINAVREEMLKYSPDQVASFRDMGESKYGGTHEDEAIRWNNRLNGKSNAMGDAEFQEIDAWARENGWNSGSEYLDAKWKYLNIMSYTKTGGRFNYANIGITQKSTEDAEAQAQSEYNDQVNAKDEEIANLKNQKHLAILQQADSKIEEYDLDATGVYDMANALSEMAGSSKEVAEGLKNNTAAAKQASVEIARFNKAIEAIGGNYGAWLEALDSGNLSEMSAAISEMKSMYANMLNMDTSDFTTAFLQDTDNLRLAMQAASGDVAAYNQLQANNLESLSVQYGSYADGVVQDLQRIAFMNEVAVGTQLEVGGINNDLALLLQQEYNEAFKVAMDATNDTVAAAAYAVNMLNAAGYNVLSTTEGAMQFSKMAESFEGNFAALQDVKAEKIDLTKHSDIVDRYKEVEDSIDDIQNAMNDAAKAADRLYGSSRLKQMEKQNDLLQEEMQLLKQKKVEAEEYLKRDKSELSKAASALSKKLTIDESGNITNYTSVMDSLYKDLAEKEQIANKFATKDEQDKYVADVIDPLQKKIEELKSAMAQYDETRELLEDIDDQIDDKWNEWQDNNYEQLTYKLELKLELNDSDLEVIDYELNKISDDFYKMAEAAALMIDSSSSSASTSQLDIYTAELKSYGDQQIALNEAFEKGEISQSSYIEGLKEVKSGIYENLQAIQELDKSMMEYYGNTLDMAADEIAKYTDRMDHQVSVLDHYSSLLEIMGKQNDYKTMHKTLEAKAQIIGDQVAVAKDTLEMYQGQAEARFNEYQDALARGDKKAAELYLKQYEAALAAANEAQDVYLSKAEEWAEALKAVLENKLADIGKTLEEALTGGTSFDEISKQMERASSLQEEYLTTTNKIYETNKMINTAQQAIDKTDNLNTKRRLRSFQEETAQMQNKGKLSEFELEIQQAKYDLLLAEIALEEAQNAKSMVRLQRDSEGNFGYVYTADDQKVAEAEQNAMDKENALYNIRLEGANSYVEKYQQTMQEMYDELQDLTDRYHNGEIESFEEYQRLMTETQNHYYQKLEDYSELYGIAIQEDTRIIEDAWSTEFASMTENTEEWKNNVDIYIREVSTAFDNYEKEMERIALETGTDMASMENSIKEVVDESKNLKDVLVGENGLISAINDQATAVANITSRYASLRDSLGLITAAYEASGKAASDAIIKQQKALQAINTTNTALKNQSGTVGEDGSLTGGGEGPEDDGGGKGPEDLEPSLIEPPKDFEVTVIPRLSHPRETESIRASRIIISDQPTSGSTDPNQMIRVTYNDGLMGNVTRKDYDAIKQYQKDLEEYYKTIASMDTGGYTGSWGTEGKLAMLHQKELVLNPDDTQNFLTSLDVLHEIIKMIDLQAINSRVGGFLQIPNMNFAPNEILNQQVHIEASFPGVTDRNEIEEAFKTLVNRASQFANRKNF